MSSKTINNIVVVGGGTAGWLTALLAKAYQPHKNVILIESDEIGILGAGEGTVPWFTRLMKQLNIPLHHIMQTCKATMKNGILFTNWNGQNDRYFHSFISLGDYSVNRLDFARNLSVNSLLISHAANEPTHEIDLNEVLSMMGKVGLVRQDVLYADTNNEFGIHDQVSEFALHFDARDLAVAFRDIALSRNIIRIEGKVVGFDSLPDGSISSINLDNGKKVSCDFVFDCSGLKRLIVGKHFGSTWKSVRDTLPCDSAIPFFIENKSNTLEPYTECIAMNHGWVWKIPVQGRYGCGYVYDSTTTNEESAKNEVKNVFGDVHFPTKFNFDAGYYEEFWIKNCIAVGLSSGFLEPLEATSIWITTHMIQYALESFDQLEKQDQFVINEYNEKFRNRFTDTIDFIRLHYITERNDTEFWRKCKTLKNSDRLNQILSKAKKRVLHYEDFTDSSYELTSWLAILRGVNLLDRNIVLEYLEKNNLKVAVPAFLKFKENIAEVAEKCVSHKEFIDRVSL